ncbi:MAG: hypothetical protein KDA68_22685 [Planctomycetaceae bacterium]|nr:hypothetical protein [Planctomycetaceae bacterium]
MMFFQASPIAKRRRISTNLAETSDSFESRLLLSAAGPVAADVNLLRQHVNQTSSLANFSGNWKIDANAVFHFTQNGNVLSGTETFANTTVANFTGTIHGQKFKGDLVTIGLNAHSIIKAHLTDPTHFTGKRHYFFLGDNLGIYPINGNKI